MAVTWEYMKLDEKGEIKYLPGADMDGSITGHVVFGLKAWMDENPEERKRLGWIKHIQNNADDIEYNKQTQYLVHGLRMIDEYTAENTYHVMDKTEEMMLLEDMLESLGVMPVDFEYGSLRWNF